MAASFLGQIGGPGDQLISLKPEMDAVGNIYVDGSFYQYADFDPSIDVLPLTSAGEGDGFVAKYDPNGSVMWARRFGGVGVDSVSSVAIDPAGSFLYATGVFSGSANFTEEGQPDATSVGQKDIFLVKLHAMTGETVWFRTLGSANQDVANDVVTDGAHVYVTGSFRGPADFDPGPDTVTLTPAGSGNSRPNDGFVRKLDAEGNYDAAWRFGGTYVYGSGPNDAGKSLALDGVNLYLQGSFGGTVDFDPSEVVQSRTSVGKVDTFIASYTHSGQLNWVKSIGSVNYDDTDFGMAADAAARPPSPYVSIRNRLRMSPSP